jgi:hypothetical protein
MRKFRAGLGRRIRYFDRKKYEKGEFLIKVETRLIDKETNKEIIFLDFEENPNFRCKIPIGLKEKYFRDFENFSTEEEREKNLEYLYYKYLYINDFMKILIENNSPKIEFNTELLAQFPFRIEYNIKYEISFSYLKNEVTVTEHKEKSQEEFFRELNNLEEISDEEISSDIREQRKDNRGVYLYCETEIKRSRGKL